MPRSIRLRYRIYPVVALVDDADYDWLFAYDWRYQGGGSVGYAYAREPEYAQMHRLLMGAGAGQLVHHRNQDGLDNRRCNLHLCLTREHLTFPHVPISDLEKRGRVWYDPNGYRVVISPERRPYQEALSQERQERRTHGGNDGE